MKKTAVIFLLMVSVQNCMAQANTAPKDSTVYDHYIGAQIGQLIMHLLNSNANSIGTGNPYLLTYSMNSKKTGWGIRFGAGYNSVSNSTAGSNTLSTTDNTDFQFRAGIEKTIKLSRKWSAGAGIDLVLNSQNDNNTTNTYNYQYDTSTTTSKTKLTSYGGGVFGKVNYHLGKKLFLGTESSFYYVTGTKNQTVDVLTTNNGNAPQTSETKSRPGISSGTISLPIVVYLIMKF